MRATIVTPLRTVRWRRGWDSNPRTPVKMLLEFQSSAFDRSATSPINYLRIFSRQLPALSSPAGRPRKGANDTPSRLRKCLLWGVEGGRRIEARIGLFPRRGGGCIQSRDVQSIGRLGSVQPGRDLQRGNAGRPHIRLGVMARGSQGSQVLATRETHEGNQDSDQRKTIPHLVTFHEWAGARP